jgi:hypothetical protein
MLNQELIYFAYEDCCIVLFVLAAGKFTVQDIGKQQLE